MKSINNRYEIIEYLGEDACGHIYRVHNLVLNRVERLKIFNNKFFKENAIKIFAERFIELSTINHPNITVLYEFTSIDTIDNRRQDATKYFYTYEDFNDIEGIDYLSLSREDTHKAIVEICRGLQYLHFRSECYTYLNFENVIFYKVDGDLKVKFKDLSHILQYKYLAKYSSKEVNQFLSPKLVWAEQIDSSADLYSLGIIFYYLYYKYDYKSVVLSLEALEDNEIHQAIHRLTTNIKEEAYKTIDAFIDDLTQLLRMPYNFDDRLYYEQLNFKNRLIGRTKEINRILRMSERSLNLRGVENCFFIHGRKGVGKSRLLQELDYRFQFQGYTVFRHACDSRNGEFVFFKEILSSIILNDIIDINLIRKYGVEIGTLMPEIAKHWHIEHQISTVEKIGALRIANRIFKFIEEYVSNKQLIFIIDKLDELDYYDGRVLEYLINTDRELPLFIVAGIDVDERNQFLLNIRYSDKKVAHMTLVNYSYSDTSEFIRACLGRGKDDIKFVSAVMNKTNGNPALIMQAIQRLFNEKKIYVDITRTWDFSQVTSFQDIVIEELESDTEIPLDEFTHIEKKLLGFLSICEIPMIDEIIMEILSLSAAEFEEAILQLKDSYIVDSKFSDWGFSYFVDNKWLKKQFVKQVSKEVAIEYHRDIANYLEQKYEVDQKFLDDRLIYHLEESNQYEKCAMYSLLYAKKLKTFSLKEAQSLVYYNKALDHASKIGNRRLVVVTHIQIGDIYQEIDRYSDALKNYKNARSIALEESLTTLEIDVVNRIGHIELKKINYNVAKGLFLFANRKARKYGYFEGEIQSAVFLVDYHMEVQSNEKALTIINHYTPLCDVEKHHRSLGRFYHRKAAYYYNNGLFLEAKDCYEKGVKILEDRGNEDVLAKCLNNLGAIEMVYLGNFEKALEYFLTAEELSIRNNIFLDLCVYKVNIGAAYFKMGVHEKALESYEKAITMASDSNDKRDFFIISSEVVRDYLSYGLYDKAFSVLKKLEMDYSGITDADKYLNEHAAMNILYFLSMENFEMAFKWYTKYKKNGALNKPRGFLIKLFETIFEENHFQNSDIVSESVLWRLTQIEDSALSVMDYQFLRGFLLRVAKKLLTSSNFILLRKFVDYDKKLAEKFNDQFCNLRHDILESMFAQDRIEANKRILENYQGEKFETILWMSHKLIGDEYSSQNMYFEAMRHYTTALDMIHNVSSKMPEDYKRQYIINDSLKLQLKNRIMELYSKIIHGRTSDSVLMIESEINRVEDFFDIRVLDELFKNSRFSQNMYESLFKKDYPQLMNVEDVIQGIAQEHETNIYGILTYFVQILCANYGRIVFNDDVNDIHKTFEIGRLIVDDVDMLKTNLYYENEGLIISNHEESLYTYLLKDGRKAILYIPIYENTSTRITDTFDDTLYENEIGYIYLESDSVLNSFNQENFERCQLMIKLVKGFIENYRLEVLSTIDKLTGVYLRKYAEERFSETLTEARRNNEELSVIMCDIDKFKHVNDTYGHRKGDEILRNIGSLLNRDLEDKGFVGRYGGEEFIIILPKTSSEKAFEICEMIREHIQQEIRVEARKPVTMSFGLASYPAHGLSEEELVENADKALYYSKNTGRNQSTVWSGEISSDQYRFDRLAGILTGNSAVDATNMQSIVEIIGMLKLKLDKNGKLLKVLENLIDITKGEIAYIVEWDGEKPKTYMKERGSNTLKTDYEPNTGLLEQFRTSRNGDYFVNWAEEEQHIDRDKMPNWKSIIVSPLFDGETSKGLVVVEVPIVEREFDFNNYNYVNLMSGLISAII